MFTFFPEILSALGKAGDSKAPAPRSNFHLNDEQKLVTDMINVGFENVKSFYTPCNECFSKKEQLWEFFLKAPSNQSMIA